jgi:hypothetical protein
MTRSFTASLIAVAFAAGLSAQTPPPQTEKQYPDKKATDARGGKTVTLSGCLREGEEPNTFVLANVDSTALPQRPAGSPSEPAGTAGASAATATVKLIGSTDINLKPHVGHKVEVTGMFVPQGQGAKRPTGTAGSTPETTSDTTAREREKGAGGEHRLNVRSLKHVSESCTM